MTPRWIDDQPALDGFVRRALDQPRYALDTEFHRERTYFPKLALMQIALGDELVLIDPLAVDVGALRPLFASESVAVVHAAQQDLDVLTHSCGAIPARIFDTQLAAGFLGYSTPSLVSLLQAELQVAAAKGDRLTDWLRRPLSEEQLSYAASDVAHLLALHDQLERELVGRGRMGWVDDACEDLRTRPVSGTEPEHAWLRIKDVRVLKPKARGVAQSVAEWRERRAMAVDVPVRQVLPDLAVLGVAQRQPKTLADLAQARGVDDRHSRGAFGRELLDAALAGAARQIHLPAPEGDELDRQLRPAITLVSAWISDVARRQHVDTALLATRADIVALLRGDHDAKLRNGWRAELIGDGIRQLLDGHAGLTFDRKGGLRLVAISGG